MHKPDLLDSQQRKIVLLHEIQAMLHDVGKFTDEFMVPDKDKDTNRTSLHTTEFRKNNRGLCHPDLLAQLERETELRVGLGGPEFKRIGDLQKYHHGAGIKNFSAPKDDTARRYPLALYLIMYADTTDSGMSKGDGKWQCTGLDFEFPKQKDAGFHLADPFGGLARRFSGNGTFDRDKVQQEARKFQQDLARLLERFDAHMRVDDAGVLRDDIRQLFRRQLSGVVADTRLPTNDVSLAHHSLSTAGLFKAMLARHLLEGHDRCHRGNELDYTLEPLALLGFHWDGSGYTGRAFRPADIYGRARRLWQAILGLRDFVEKELCLGNAVFTGPDMACFLLPGLEQEHKQALARAIESAMERLWNDRNTLGGDVPWSCRWLDVSTSEITRFAAMLRDPHKGELLCAGPARPAWTVAWQGQYRSAVCSRCGLRPVAMQPLVIGSSGDSEQNICDSCQTLAHQGRLFRRRLAHAAADDTANPEAQRLERRVAGMDIRTCRWMQTDLGALARPGEQGRVVLVQGVLDASGFMGGQDLALMLRCYPGRFKKTKNTPAYLERLTEWKSLVQLCADALKIPDGEEFDTMREAMRCLFRDGKIGDKEDGRVVGKDGHEKYRRFLDTMAGNVADSTWAGDDQALKIVAAAFAKHPAPSRLGAVMDHCLDFGREAAFWCEQNKVSWVAAGLEPFRFRLIVPLEAAWELLVSLRQSYLEKFARATHLLPLHLSAVVFYHKAPLYLAMDAANRFAALGRRWSAEPAWHRVTERLANDPDRFGLRLTREDCPRPMATTLWWPRTLPDGTGDLCYGWCLVRERSGRPVHVSDVQEGWHILARPSSFDYEVLDATVRRYDIRMDPQTMSRPHISGLDIGPRPLPLDTIGRWHGFRPELDRVSTAGLKHLRELLFDLYGRWRDARYDAARRTVFTDTLSLTFGTRVMDEYGDFLVDAAMDGSLADMLEWYFLCSEKRREE